MSLSKVMLYWHTLRFLKPVQIYGRFLFHLYQPNIKKGFQDLKTANYENSLIPPLKFGGSWFCENEKFFFESLNEVSEFNEAFWVDASASYLQLYTRHYFDAVRTGNPNITIFIIENWIDSNPIGSRPGWEPYPLSLRIVNWIFRHLVLGNLPEPVLCSLADQVRYLQKRFETHLQGNHLFVNGKATIFGGCFFKGIEADLWLDRGLNLLREEISEQILKDGTHYEISPMYHAIFLIDLLDLINLSNVYPEAIPVADIMRYRSTANRMLYVLKVLCHPDGRIASFGDSSLDEIPEYSKIEKYALDLNIKKPSKLQSIEYLENSGYIRLSVGSVILIIKAGGLGPDYLLGHAHADNLTFELSINQKRIVVDTGVDRYGADAERMFQRSTTAHNTVVVDDISSSEVWSGFRVARRARPLKVIVEKCDDHLCVRCGHTGYHMLSDPVTHYRTFRLNKDYLLIEDTLRARKTHSYLWNLFTREDVKIICDSKQINPESCQLNIGFGNKIKGYHYQMKTSGSTVVIESRIEFKNIMTN